MRHGKRDEKDPYKKSYEGVELLLTFVVVVHEGALNRAAKRLSISRTTVRNRLRSLETLMNTTLVREGTRLELTPAGQVLWERVRGRTLHLLAEWGTIRDGLDQGVLRVAATGVAIQHLLREICRRFHDRYPEIRIEIIRSQSREIPTLLTNDRADFGLGRDPGLETARVLGEAIPLNRLTIIRYRGSSLFVGYPRRQGMINWPPDLSIHEINARIGWVRPREADRGKELLGKIVGDTPRIIADIGFENAVVWAADGFGAVLAPENLLRPHVDRLHLIVPQGLGETESHFPGALMWLGGMEALSTPWKRGFVELFGELVPLAELVLQ